MRVINQWNNRKEASFKYSLIFIMFFKIYIDCLIFCY